MLRLKHSGLYIDALEDLNQEGYELQSEVINFVDSYDKDRALRKLVNEIESGLDVLKNLKMEDNE